MKHSNVYISVMNAINEQIADQSTLIDLIKTINLQSENDSRLDLLDSELDKLCKLVTLKGEIALLITDKEFAGDL